jgi:rare lipoprotein A
MIGFFMHLILDCRTDSPIIGGLRMKRTAAFLILASISVIIAFADGAYMRNFRQRGSATFEIATGDLVAAHPSLPQGTPVTITNLQNNKQITVIVDERTVATAQRVIVLSWGAAAALGVTVDDVVPITLSVERVKSPTE